MNSIILIMTVYCVAIKFIFFSVSPCICVVCDAVTTRLDACSDGRRRDAAAHTAIAAAAAAAAGVIDRCVITGETTLFQCCDAIVYVHHYISCDAMMYRHL